MATLSQFARGLSTETAFDVLAVAKKLKAQGKDVIELQIGDRTRVPPMRLNRASRRSATAKRTTVHQWA